MKDSKILAGAVVVAGGMVMFGLVDVAGALKNVAAADTSYDRCVAYVTEAMVERGEESSKDIRGAVLARCSFR